MADTIPAVRRPRWGRAGSLAVILGLMIAPGPRPAPAQALSAAVQTPTVTVQPLPAPAQPPPAAAAASAPAGGQAEPCGDFPPDSPQACSGKPLDYHSRIHIALHTVALLPTGRQGRAYRPTEVVHGGVPDYEVERQAGLPPGLSVTSAGVLQGTPTKSGAYVLRLVVRDSASPPNETRGDFDLRILGPVRTTAIPPPPPPPAALSPPAPPSPPVRRGVMTVYMLTAADLKALDTPPAPPPPPPSAPPGTGAAAATPGSANSTPPVAAAKGVPAPAVAAPPKPPAAPIALTPVLGRLVNMEYPSRALFDAALRQKLLPYPGLYEKRQDAIYTRATRVEYFRNSPRLAWSGESNCNCVHPQPRDYRRVVYGFFPFWRSTAPGQTINFSLIDRIGFLGAQLADNGAWITPSNGVLSADEWWQDTSEFARAAHSHGTDVDLVLQRRDWSFLTGLSVQTEETLGEAAAIRAVKLADTPLTDSAAFARGFLWGIWPKPTHVFDGVTVMFDPPADDAREQAAFANFFDSFMWSMVREMQKNKRPYTLNIVMADTMICNPRADSGTCNPGEFSLVNLMRYKHYAEPAKQRLELSPEEKRYYYGRTQIKVRFLVMIHDPSRVSQDVLRRNIDSLNDTEGQFDFTGPARSTLLQSIIPIVSFPAGGLSPAAPGEPNRLFDRMWLDYGFAYFAENFGGAGMWPTPVDGVDAGPAVYKAIKHNFLLEGLKICSTLLRLLWQLAVILVPLFALLYFFVDASIRTRLVLLGCVAVSLVLAVVLGLVLLELDPALNTISEGNLILIFGLMALAFLAVWFAARPKVRDP